MTADPKWSFEAHSRNSLVLARNNLAEVTLFRLETAHNRLNPANTWHLIGNLVVAAEAAADTGSYPSEAAAEAIAEVGGDYERAQEFFDKVITLKAVRNIFSLRHIPDDAPEIHITKRSRQLNIAEFIKQAHLLNPDAHEPGLHEGSARGLFLGSYERRLS